MRHGRLRCRNNKALYNYLGQAFPELRFTEVQKRIEFGSRKGETYMGLKIIDPSGLNEIEDED